MGIYKGERRSAYELLDKFEFVDSKQDGRHLVIMIPRNSSIPNVTEVSMKVSPSSDPDLDEDVPLNFFYYPTQNSNHV